MPVGLSKRPETAVEQATKANDRTQPDHVRYVREWHNESAVYFEVGVKDTGGAEQIINYSHALAQALLNVAGDRTAHGTIIVGEQLARFTVDESTDVEGEELRHKLVAGLRIT